ncbi:hypothetical protein MBLNU230_g6580t1 [Neophaeotheca triangularis]
MDVHHPLPATPSLREQRWSEASKSRRPKSQPPSSHASRSTPKKRSPNHVRARPADPTVISSIISSLEALPLSNGTASNGQQEAPSRRWSSAGGARSRRSKRFSLPAPGVSGFGMEYETGAPTDDEGSSSDAAMPPTIRTSRAPSGQSTYSRSRSPSLSRSTTQRFKPASVASRKSSWSGPSKDATEGGAQNGKKLSADGWNKSHGASRESLESQGSRSNGGGGSVRRMSSYETFRADKRVTVPEQIAERPDTSAGEEVIVKTPPQKISKARLYLTDTTIEEETIASESPNSTTQPEAVDNSRRVSKRPTETLSQPSVSSVKTSPKESPITDSIPLRTSSLRHTKSPSAQKRKEKKKRSNLMEPSDCKPSPMAQSHSVDETSWADLGEEDGTVRRIRQLKQLREQRIRESKDLSGSPVQDESSGPMAPFLSESPDTVGYSRPTANRASTEPPAKAHRLLGIASHQSIVPSLNSANHLRGPSPERVSVEQNRKRTHSAEGRTPTPNPSMLVRPPTANSDTLNFSLDYSYVQAVDALQDLDKKAGASKGRSSGIPTPMDEYDPFANNNKTNRTEPTARSLQQTTSEPAGKLKTSQRWITNHPDLPTDSQRRKSRRRSMSDARNGNVADEEREPIPRRDSVEDDVLEYLQHPRLSRRVKSSSSARSISYSEVGDPDGAAVFVCVGMGLTRFVTAFYDELATTLRLRLITIDRPGVGGSDPYPANYRTGPLGWPDDVLAICQELGIAKFSILAHSAGAIYALATALILPQMVKGKVHLLAPWIPPSQLETISHPTSSAPPAGALPRSQRLLRVLPTPFLKAANSSFMNATSASLKPANKRQVKASKDAQRQASLSPARPPLDNRPTSSEGTNSKLAGRPDYNRRQSMMTMDQDMPIIDPRSMENFPLHLSQDDLTRLQTPPKVTPKRSSVVLSATASPTDPALDYAATALNAAEHAARERQLEYTSRLTQHTWELAIRDSNPATDLLVCLERNRDVGFRYTDVGVETVVTHGSDDKRVPLANVRWLAEQMNRRAWVGNEEAGREGGGGGTGSRRGRCEVRVLQGEGHGLMASPFVMGECLTDIAGYWVGDAGKGRVAV